MDHLLTAPFIVFVCYVWRMPNAQVWEIIGAELTKSTYGAGISIRHPRFYRVRDDKGSDDATSMSELEQLHRTFANVAPKKI